MVRYDREHKARSRQQIVDAAADLFRREGFRGVGIDTLCKAAGLTRGAFYAHFPSKGALLSAVMENNHDLLKRLRERSARSTSSLVGKGVQVLRDYLHPDNTPAVIAGCSLASLAMDTARADPGAQRAYAETIDAVVEELMRGRPPEDRNRVRAALAMAIGGLLINSACGAEGTGVQMAQAARREATRLLEAG